MTTSEVDLTPGLLELIARKLGVEPSADLQELLSLQLLQQQEGKARKLAKGAADYVNDPLGFIDTYVRFPGKQRLAPYQRETLGDIPVHHRVAVRGPRGLGKALKLSMRIPTPSGWSTIGMLRPGDEVFDENGKPCNVVGKSRVFKGPTYEVEFADGTVITTHANHEWVVLDTYNRPGRVKISRNRYSPCMSVSDWRDHWAVLRTVTTEYMASRVRTAGRGDPRWHVPTARPLEMPTADLPVDPYTLGVWLGDGDTGSPCLTLNRDDSAEILQRVPSGHFVPSGDRPSSVRFHPDGLQKALRQMGLIGNKHIPITYLRASAEQRRELVRGLWDTDGYKQAGGGTDEITLTCRQLAHDTAELLRSLGLVTRMRQEVAKIDGRVIGPKWRIATRFDFRPYHLKRYYWRPLGGQASRHTQRSITDIRRVEDQPTQCIEVDSPSHLYLASESFIPTHNSAEASLAILWFASTREAAGIDWKVATTAGSWAQLKNYLWPEVHKWVKRIDWKALGRSPLNTRSELLNTEMHLSYGNVSSASPKDSAKLEGLHADHVMFVFDESKIIPASTFDSAEGSFSAVGDDDDEADESLCAYALAISTPGEPSGRFYDIHRHAPGLEDWHTRHVTLEEAIAAGRMSRKWAEQRRKMWGETSALYQNHVLGEFCASDEDAIIPLRRVEEAIARWRGWDADGRPDPEGVHLIGVDVARSGQDKSVLAFRSGDVITHLAAHAKADTMATTGIVKAALDADPSAKAVVDIIGVGAGVYDRLKEQDARCEAFVSSKKTSRKDKTNHFGMLNLRAAAFWHLREILDDDDCKVCLPPDDELLGDLTSIHYKHTSAGLVQIESKDDIRKRIGRSTDKGDAVAMALFDSMGDWASAYNIIKCPNGQCPRGAFYANDDSGRERVRCPWCGTSLLDGETPAGPAAPQPSAYPAAALMGHATRQPGMQQLTQLLGRKVSP